MSNIVEELGRLMKDGDRILAIVPDLHYAYEVSKLLAAKSGHGTYNRQTHTLKIDDSEVVFVHRDRQHNAIRQAEGGPMLDHLVFDTSLVPINKKVYKWLLTRTRDRDNVHFLGDSNF